MLDDAATIARLRDAGFARVEGVLDYAALTAPPAYLPALYVVPEDEDAGANTMVGVHDQRIVARFRVVAIVGAALRPDVTADALRNAVVQIRDTLTGWTHPEASGATEYVGGRLQAIEPGTVAWGVRFRAPYRFRR